MSMICCLRQVEDECLDRLLAEPEFVFEFVHGRRPVRRQGFFARLLGRKPEESEAPDWVTEAERVEIDLDKAWHGIHYLLTGTDWEGEEPLCCLVRGGEEIGNVDVGYGPARGLRQIKEFLGSIGGDQC